MFIYKLQFYSHIFDVFTCIISEILGKLSHLRKKLKDVYIYMYIYYKHIIYAYKSILYIISILNMWFFFYSFIFSERMSLGREFICFSFTIHFVKSTLARFVNPRKHFHSSVLCWKVQLRIIHNSHIIFQWMIAVCSQRTIICNLMIWWSASSIVRQIFFILNFLLLYNLFITKPNQSTLLYFSLVVQLFSLIQEQNPLLMCPLNPDFAHSTVLKRTCFILFKENCCLRQIKTRVLSPLICSMRTD